MSGSVGLITVQLQPQLQSQMLSQAYANYAMGCYSICFCFQIPMWLPCSQMGTQPVGFALAQPFRVHCWQEYVPSGAGP